MAMSSPAALGLTEGATSETPGTSRLKYIATTLQLLVTCALTLALHYLGCGRFEHLKTDFCSSM